MNQIYKYQSVFYKHKQQLVKFVFIGCVDYDEDQNLDKILNKLEKNEYDILNKAYDEDYNNFQFLQLFLNLPKEITQEKFVKDLQQTIVENKKPQLYFIKDFLFEWETIAEIKQKIFINCQSKINFLYDLPYLSLTINNNNQINDLKYLLHYYKKKQNIIVLTTLFDDLLELKMNVKEKDDTIEIQNLTENQEKLDQLLSTKYKLIKLLPKSIKKNKITEKHNLANINKQKKEFTFYINKTIHENNRVNLIQNLDNIDKNLNIVKLTYKIDNTNQNISLLDIFNKLQLNDNFVSIQLVDIKNNNVVFKINKFHWNEMNQENKLLLLNDFNKQTNHSFLFKIFWMW